MRLPPVGAAVPAFSGAPRSTSQVAVGVKRDVSGVLAGFAAGTNVAPSAAQGAGSGSARLTGNH